MKNIKTYDNFKEISFKDIAGDKYLETSYVDVQLPSRNITNLNGIGKFKNIESLDITKNEITSLKGIENLKNINSIWCYINQITSLEPLKNLINLTYLSCSNNNISTLKPLENLTKLDSLYCQNNPIDWIDYIDKKGNTWYVVLPKSIKELKSDKFMHIKEYWKFMDQNQPAMISRKFNF